jgi:GAF domain-containing protein
VFGIVEAVDLEKRLVVLSVGRDQGARDGQRFLLGRDDEYVCEVKVVQLYDDFVGAAIIETRRDFEVEAGDQVRWNYEDLRIPGEGAVGSR